MAISPEVQAERDRCENLTRTTAEHWLSLAAKIRREGTFTVRAIWPPFKKTDCVRPNWERYASHIEEAAAGLLLLADVIKAGGLSGR